MAQRLGIGLALLYRLFVVTEAEGYWTLQVKMMTENAASFTPHAKAGFKKSVPANSMSFRQADRLPFRRCAVMIEDRSEGFDLCALLARRRADDQVILHGFPVEMGVIPRR